MSQRDNGLAKFVCHGIYQGYFSYILLVLGLGKSFVILRSSRGYNRGSLYQGSTVWNKNYL